ncbi:MAG: flagellar biosynthetic protein FliR [Clostridiaceae bacterium]|nr:flagellar biosynthetic protein FliR [Clostridiaceae bacterium]
MSWPLFDVEKLPYILLILVRTSGMFFLSPVFGHRNIPARFKIGFCIILTLVFYQIYPVPGDYAQPNLFGFVLQIFHELSVGLMFSFLTLLFFSITYMAGQVIDIQMGVSISAAFDPSIGVQTTISAMFLNLAMILYFFVNNGHLRLIQIMGVSFRYLPVGRFTLNKDVVYVAVDSFVLVFSLAVGLMLPIIGASLLCEAALGIIMRAVPNFHAYMVGIPLKIGLGLVVLFAMQPFYIGFCDQAFEKLFTASEQLLTSLGAVA